MEGIAFTIGVIGDGNVGKSALINAELEVEVKNKRMFAAVESKLYPDGTVVRYIDIPGAPRFMRQLHRYCSVCAAIVCVFDRTDRTTLLHIEDWLSSVGKANGIPFFLVGNKSDLPTGANGVSSETMKQFADEHNMTLVETHSGMRPTMFESVIGRIQDRLHPMPLPGSLLGNRIHISPRSGTTSDNIGHRSIQT